MNNNLPVVSIVIPCRNEERAIRQCLRSITDQIYPQDKLEVLVVDGLSTDNTLKIIDEVKKESQTNIKVLINNEKITPIAMNMGIKEAQGDIIIILSGHIFLQEDFVMKNIETLKETNADCVGGYYENIPDTKFAKYASVILKSPFGVGNTKYRISQKKQYVDTVAFGAYKKQTFEKYGLFDEKLVRNQDVELNSRIINNGGKIFFNPEIKSYYKPRTTFNKYIKQNYGNGFWHIETLKVNKKALGLRHLVPFFFVVGLSMALLLSIYTKVLLNLILIPYVTLSIIESFRIGMKYKDLKIIIVLPFLFLLTHLSYGFGTLMGLIRSIHR